jgi:hypothetical protein
MFGLIRKYIKIKPYFIRKANQFFDSNLKGHYVISIHYRGTDKRLEAPRVPYNTVCDAIREYMTTHGPEDYKIFVATDEEQFLQHVKMTFRGLVAAYPSTRSMSQEPIHHGQSISPHQLGEEAIIDCLLLSQGRVLLRTASNLSAWASYFNPEIPIVQLSSSYDPRFS